tara:strand:- start:1969 stop:2964 length:996 start_codon:yes stop_codon:yes gene_type:complete
MNNIMCVKVKTLSVLGLTVGNMARRRVILFFLLVISIVYFLINKENWVDDAKLLFAGWIIICAGLLFFGPTGKPKRKRVRNMKNLDNNTINESEELIYDEDEDDEDLPEPVVAKNQDAKTLRELKLAKIANKNALAQAEIDEEIVLEEIEVVEIIEEEEEEEYSVASEYVIDVDADTMEDIEIVNAVGERRSVHDRIRKRIEERRRNQMAEIRASKARMWNEKDKREDLTVILSREGHGLTVLSEPEKVTPGRPYGATYVRIDESKILKLRFPLDDGFRKVDSKVQEKLELPDLPPLPLIDGQLPPIEGLPPLDLADLPPIEGLPPLPPLK